MLPATNPAIQRHRVYVARWLFAVAAMVFGMVVIGGLTRLTHSGLSMVNWHPVTGWLPPMTTAQWEAAFAAYQQYPEYQKVNAGMTLTGFQEIFWLEFIHRLWGRLIGVVFAVPFVFFLLRGWIERAMVPRLVLLFALGGLQGVLGWYMVKSGMVDRPDVSQYRLAAHLVSALIIYAALIWVALGFLETGRERAGGAGLHRHAVALVVLVLVTATSGGFVAGLDAGFAYNTFPLMDGELIPEHLFDVHPWYLSFFDDVTTVQFTHRVLALTTLAVALALWLRARRRMLPGDTARAVHAVAAMALVQVALGISTLLLIVPVPLAAAHQAGSVVLLTAAVWAAFTTRRSAAYATAEGPEATPV